MAVRHGKDGRVGLAVRFLEKALQHRQFVIAGAVLIREQGQRQTDVRVFPALRRLFFAAGLVHALFVKAHLPADPQIGQKAGQLFAAYPHNAVFKAQKFQAHARLPPISVAAACKSA